MTQSAPPLRLKREIGIFQVFAICTGVMFSSGFFLLPGLAFAKAGPSVVLAYLLAGILMIPAMFSQAELCTAMPRAGGTYYYIDRTLGPMVGTIGGLGTWAVMMLKSAFALIGMGAYILLFIDIPIKVLALVLVGLYTLLNIVGVKQTTRLQVILVSWLMVVLVLFFTEGMRDLLAMDPATVFRERFQPFFEHGYSGLVATIGLVGVSFAGLTNVASLSEEVADPERNIPRGMIASLTVATITYVIGVTLIVTFVPAETLAGDLTPVATAAAAFFNWVPVKIAVLIIAAAAIAGFASAANAGFMSASRYPLAMARDNLLPSSLAVIGRFSTPVRAVLLTSALMVVAILTLDVLQVAKLASSMQLFIFALLNLAVIVMRESRISSYDPGYHSPFYPWMQLAGMLISTILIIEMGMLPMLFTGAVIVAGLVWYRIYARNRVNRGGAIFHVFAHLGQRRFEGLDRELRTILKEKGLRHDDPFDEVVAKAAAIDTEGCCSHFDEITHEASRHLAHTLPFTEDELVTGFEEGTRLGSTPVAMGAALPHILLPGIDHPHLVLVRSQGGIHIEPEELPPEYSDHGLIRAFFFLISPEHDPGQHLRILAQLAGRVDDADFMAQWLGARNEQELKEVLLRDERFLSLQLKPEGRGGWLIGHSLSDLDLPTGCLVALIRRNDDLIIPRGDTVLEVGDWVTIIGSPEGIQGLRENALAPQPAGSRPSK
jgi:amino acid transporter/mannitol/fructose-specific phosphotransferase system IIA component (Ntr-type)